MSSKVDEDLNWLATQYVLGELSGADRESFETRLAGDVAACEAVMSASRLLLTVQAVSAAPTPAVSTPATNLRRSARGAWAAVAAVCMAVVALCLIPFSTPDTVESVASNDSAAQLVSLWRTGGVPDEDLEEVDDSVDDDVAVPGWMIAAVSLEAQAKELGGRGPGDGIDGASGKVQEN